MEVTGTICYIGAVHNVTDKFRKREFAIIEEPKGRRSWDNYIRLQCEQRDVFLLNDFQVGQKVRIEFEIKGTMYEKDGHKLFPTNLKVLSIEALGVLLPRPSATEEIDPFDDLAHYSDIRP